MLLVVCSRAKANYQHLTEEWRQRNLTFHSPAPIPLPYCSEVWRWYHFLRITTEVRHGASEVSDLEPERSRAVAWTGLFAAHHSLSLGFARLPAVRPRQVALPGSG